MNILRLLIDCQISISNVVLIYIPTNYICEYTYIHLLNDCHSKILKLVSHFNHSLLYS